MHRRYSDERPHDRARCVRRRRHHLIVTPPLPPELLPRSIATCSLLAHIITDKLCDSLPLHRQEDRFARLGVTLDRGTMSRWVQDLGLTVLADPAMILPSYSYRT